MSEILSGAAAAVVLAGLMSLASCSSPSVSAPPPAICTQLAGANDIDGISVAIDNVAPGHDYSANELKAEPVVNASCPDQAYKLQRYREQILNAG